MDAFAVQYAVGLRMIDHELKQGSGRTTMVYSNNLAKLKGTAMENLPSQQNYAFARRAMHRQAQTDKVVDLQYVPTDRNLADMNTKPLPVTWSSAAARDAVARSSPRSEGALWYWRTSIAPPMPL